MTARKRRGNQGGGKRSGRGDQTQVHDIQAVASSSPRIKSLMKSAPVHVKYPNNGEEHFTEVLVASTFIVGKVIYPPKLKLSQDASICEEIVKERTADWKYSGNCFAAGTKVERWALVNLSSNVTDRDFIEDLRWRSRKLGMDMEEPAFTVRCIYGIDNMDVFSSVEKIRKFLQNGLGKYCKGIQIIILIMPKKHDSYGYLKWVLETKIGIISQFCLEKSYSSTTKAKWAFLDNICMKINGKIGGSHVELINPLTHCSVGDHVVMLIGAAVNHPEAKDETSPSIAAVVGSVNWPAANRYVARIKPQAHRCKRIVNFGAICKDLVNTFSTFNKVKPDKIVVFRYSVGHEGKPDKVVNRELRDLKVAISTYDYKPSVTLVLVQKRHHTLIFRHKGRGEIENVLPGTVVDNAIAHQSTDLDFYLWSHYNGGTVTSKAMHYRVLCDQNSFPSRDLQKLIYHLCYTYAGSIAPVSPVPPVHYAKLAATRGRMYYEAANQCKKESDADTSSSPSSPNPSVKDDQDFCRLHPDLVNEMFFI